jgi:hypothetical protein
LVLNEVKPNVDLAVQGAWIAPLHRVTQGRELNGSHKKTGIIDAGFLFDDERAA